MTLGESQPAGSS